MSVVGVGSWIERRARMAPDHPAIITATRSLTYAQLASRIRRLANGLRQLGVRRGDRVAWIGPNDPAFLECLFATGLAGAVLAPVNHRLSEEERGLVLADTQPVIIVEHQPIPSPTSAPPSVQHRVTVGPSSAEGVDYELLIARSPDIVTADTADLSDLLLLPHTSGTTGPPKGVMLTHGNVTWNALNFLTSADFRGDDVTIAIAPFFRVGGTGVNVLPLLLAGGTVVVPATVDADVVLAEIARHRVTIGFGNPDLLDALARSERWLTADLSSLRFIVTGGAPVPERLLRAYVARGLTLLQGYGLSEAGPLALLLDPVSALERIGSAGRPPLFVDVRIVDPGGRDAAPGQTGELTVRGPNVMAGYWNRPEATAAVLTSDGWLHTGDAARADADGFVWIVDRLDAAFVTEGGSVYPGDVERVLLTHSAVADAGVVGVASSTGHEVGVAFVVVEAASAPTEAELLALARKHLDPHAVPRSVRFLAELPRNSVGKLRRRELAAMVGPQS